MIINGVVLQPEMVV